MSARRRKERLTLLGAVVLLAAVVVGWWLLGARAEEKRAEALAGVPEFPHPGQVSVRREPNQKLAPAPKPVVKAAPPPLAEKRKADRMNSFVLAPASTVTLIHVNALFNTPLFDRFRECAPPEWKKAEAAAQKEGIDLEHDIDRMAMVPGGVAVSGFFEGKPVAQTLAAQRSADGETQSSSYRDQTIYTMTTGGCAVQMGNMLLFGNASGCEPLIDRALDPPEDADDGTNELYGDIYMRSDLSGLVNAASRQGSAQGDAFAQLFGALSGATMRANVWDDVAVSFEGDPKSDGELRDLTHMARGALSVARGQMDDDDNASALAELAKVNGDEGKLKIDLALPADQLFSRFHIPCPGMADGGTSADGGKM